VYFSGKISHSVLLYLESFEADLEGLFELTELNLEFLSDPTSWLEAHQLENFLYQLQQIHEKNYPCFIQKAGEHCPELKAWGVLDGVLKMMDQASDFYAQPERLISYFISPAPQVHSLEQTPGTVSFDTPISAIEFPIVSEFLKGAFGSLPAYMGKAPAKVNWEETQIQINYGSSNEASEHAAQSNQRQQAEVTPELIDSVFHTLEVKQFEIDSKNKALNLKEQELLRLKKDLKFLVNKSKQDTKIKKEVALSDNCEAPLDELLQNVQKFNDYFSRAQQLITLLVGAKRLDPQVRAAMKRVKWDQVGEFSPFLVQKLYSQINELKNSLEPLVLSSEDLSQNKLNTQEVELNIEQSIFNASKENIKPQKSPTDSFLIDNLPI
jgi:hypothetical protein